MRRMFLWVLFLVLVFGTFLKANAIGFEEGLSESYKKPLLVIVYADWADNYTTYLQKFRGLNQTFGDKFNYLELDIADSEAKAFNAKYHIYPNLPYVLMFKEGGKISRYLQKECVSNDSCLIPRVEGFLQ